jgi:type I restriction enzyme S subunit
MPPSQWCPRRLDELGFVGRGKSRHRPRNDTRLYGGPYPFIQTAEIIAADPYITTYSQTYSDYGMQQSKMWPANTLCIAIAGANTAKTAILKFDACFPDSVVGFIPDSDKSDLHFIKYSLDYMRHQFLAVSRGATQDNQSLEKLLSIPILVPELDEQRRIAGILSAYDELINNSWRRIRILEAMARALYREWFVHFRFPGHESVPRVPSPLGEIPQGWWVKKLESLMTGHIGGGWGKEEPDDDHTEPAWVIRGTDIPDARSSQVACVPRRFHSPLNLRSRKLATGDILFEVSGGGKGQPVGRTLLVTPHLMSCFRGDVICATFCKRIRPDAANYGAELLYLSFLEGYASGEIEQFQVQSTGIFNVKWNAYIAKTERVVPPEPLRSSFREQVVPLFAEVATLGLRIQNLRRTRDLLLPRLISGQIHVEALNP